jgi:hypothetical protein
MTTLVRALCAIMPIIDNPPTFQSLASAYGELVFELHF